MVWFWALIFIGVSCFEHSLKFSEAQLPHLIPTSVVGVRWDSLGEITYEFPSSQALVSNWCPPKISCFCLLSEMRALHFHCLRLVFISPPPLFPSCHSIALTCFITARLLYGQLRCIPVAQVYLCLCVCVFMTSQADIRDRVLFILIFP